MKAPLLTSLSHHLFVYRGVVNVGVIYRGEEALLIDIGDGTVVDVLHQQGIPYLDGVLLTHHHRDQASGAYGAMQEGAWTGAPEAERALFEDVQHYWSDPRNRWHRYHFRPHHVLTEAVPIDRTFVDGDTFRWAPARITALHTPGHTDGSMTYLVDVDGQRIAFCGDLIFDEGQILDLYSLQKGFGDLTDYHGFMSAWREVIASLRRVENAGATVLVPSQGNIIRDPKAAIDLLERRLQKVYDSYLSTSALWYYFPDLLQQQSLAAKPIATAPTIPAPHFVRHGGTSWAVLSDDGYLLLMDCGSEEVIQLVDAWLASGDVKGVDALWITHYHDDHVDFVPQFKDRFGCEVIAERSVASVISQPLAWQLPCLSPSVVEVDRVVTHGERWSWREFTLTAYHFPGQSLYHSGLAVEGHGVRLFFCGDSLTPTGIDDYCAFNRNLLGEGVGYDFCLKLLEELQPDLLFNCHVDEPFAPSPEDYRAWRARLNERKQLLAQLLPHDSPNEGLDPYRAHCYPYEQQVQPGACVQFDLVFCNTATAERVIRCVIAPSRLWREKPSAEIVRTVDPQSQQSLPLRIVVPPETPSDLYVVAVSILDSREQLIASAEALIRVTEQSTQRF